MRIKNFLCNFKIFSSLILQIFLIILILNITIKQINSQDFDINDSKFYINEICSYNQEKYETKDKNIVCKCSKGYTTYNPNNEIKFGQYPIQCNYEQKRGYIVFFFSFFPFFGIDHYYLEKYHFFIGILVLYLGTIFALCCFTIFSNFKRRESQNKYVGKFKILLPILCTIVWGLNLLMVIQAKQS